jgi:hypothetical protein
MSSTLVPLGSAVVSAVAVGLVTFLATRWKVSRDFELEVDRTLRTDRITVYRKLWAITEPLAFYGRDGDLTYRDLRDLTVALRGWYFTEGGILLSRTAYKRYMALQNQLRAILETDRARKHPGRAADWKSEFALVQARGSDLRSALAGDIGGRLLGIDPTVELPTRDPELNKPGPA